MAKFVMTNVRTFAGGADLSGDVNEATIATKVDDRDVTNYNSAGWKEHLGGLAQASLAIKGFYEAGGALLNLPDDTFTIGAGLGNAGGYTIAPQGAADQATAYFTNAVQFDFNILGKTGDVAPFEITAQSTWPLVRGIIAAPAGSALTTSGTGTINQLGAVAAGQYIYADLHVYSVSGTTPSITFTVQSAATVGFGSPTTRLTFNAVTTTPGGQIMRLAGPITDQYWRAQWTVTGTSPSYLAVMAFGIR